MLRTRARARAQMGSGRAGRDREEAEIRRKRRTNKMLIAMVSIFVCCWLPLNVVHIVSEYKPALLEWRYFSLIFFEAHVIAMSSTIYNPFLYAWMNENFQKEFKQVLPFLFSTRGRHGNALNGVTSQYTTVDTQTSMVPRSPPKEPNANTVNCSSKEACAEYVAESEKVCLKVNDDTAKETFVDGEC